MKLNPKNGIDQLLFGMKQKDVIDLYGTPNKKFEDDDSNMIFLYNDAKLRLTFYQDEDLQIRYKLLYDEENKDLNAFITINDKAVEEASNLGEVDKDNLFFDETNDPQLVKVRKKLERARKNVANAEARLRTKVEQKIAGK